VAEFFADYGMVAGSLKHRVDEETGRKKGDAAALFEDCVEAERAIKDKQKQEIAGRWVMLAELDMDDYNDYENYDPESKVVRCSDALNEDNWERSVKMRGLPWAANKGTVIEFFAGFKISKKDITIDIQGGKNSGFAIVHLENEEEAARAIEELDKKEIGSRWIGISAAEMRKSR
jgi:RNA recognition motif-containing protein